MATTTKRPRFEYGLLGGVYYRGKRIGWATQVGRARVWIAGTDHKLPGTYATRYEAAKAILGASR